MEDLSFKENYLIADARKIVLAYKTLLVFNSPMRKLGELAPLKISEAISRSRNLVCALLVQGILNDSKLPQLADDFGNSLAKEADFREYLQKLASIKLFPILKEVLSDKTYAQKIKIEKYSFLRSKEIYRRCLEVAYDKYNWTKKSAKRFST